MIEGMIDAMVNGPLGAGLMGSTVLAATDHGHEAASAALGGITLQHYLLVSAVTFGIGLLVCITRRNAVAVLMGIELMVNAAALNFVAFGMHSASDAIDGQVVTLFVIVIAAAEAALALAIVMNVFTNLGTVQVDEAKALQG